MPRHKLAYASKMRTAVLVAATSRADAFKVEVMATKLQGHATVVLVYEDIKRANGTLPRCHNTCVNMERHLVQIPLPLHGGPLWKVGHRRPATYCGVRRHTVSYSAVCRYRILAPLTLGLVYRYDVVGWTDADVEFLPAAIPRMFPIPLSDADVLHGGVMHDTPSCSIGVTRFFTEQNRAYESELSEPELVVYGNFWFWRSDYFLRIAPVAFAWYYDRESWKYRWGDQQFSPVLKLIKARVVDCAQWRLNDWFVHNNQSGVAWRRHRRRDKSHLPCPEQQSHSLERRGKRD